MVRPYGSIKVRWFAAIASLVAASGFVPAAEPSQKLLVAYRGALTLPEDVAAAADTRLRLVGLSGITWLGGERYVAVMDNSASLVRFHLTLAADGKPVAATAFESVALAERHDYEDVAPRLGGAAGVFLCEEDTPAIRMFSLANGAAAGVVGVPRIFRGRRVNRGFEALALDPDGLHLWTANEEALSADGPAAVLQGSTVVRLTRLPTGGAGKAFQVGYRVDPPHAFVPVVAGPTFSGVVALVALGRDRLLVLERSAGPGLPPFESRIYFVDTARAVDVSDIDAGLAGRPDSCVEKTLLWSGALGLNLEGLCLGPRLAADRRALVGIADNGGLETPTQVTGFELSVTVTRP
ncbi:MAG: esterase-like activity of phytase family protein [Planctomycetia bacterium]